MIDIQKITDAELEFDLQDSIKDIGVCELSLSLGVTSYSGGLVQDRINGNKHIIEVITKELKRRTFAIRCGT